MTPGQEATLTAIQQYRDEHGYAPTFREIATRLGVSLATVRQRIDALERDAVLTHEPGVCRSLRTKERN